MTMTNDTKRVQTILDQYSAEGWELVTAQYAVMNSGVPAFLMWFKRPARS